MERERELTRQHQEPEAPSLFFWTFFLQDLVSIMIKEAYIRWNLFEFCIFSSPTNESSSSSPLLHLQGLHLLSLIFGPLEKEYFLSPQKSEKPKLEKNLLKKNQFGPKFLIQNNHPNHIKKSRCGYCLI